MKGVRKTREYRFHGLGANPNQCGWPKCADSYSQNGYIDGRAWELAMMKGWRYVADENMKAHRMCPEHALALEMIVLEGRLREIREVNLKRATAVSVQRK